MNEATDSNQPLPCNRLLDVVADENDYKVTLRRMQERIDLIALREGLPLPSTDMSGWDTLDILRMSGFGAAMSCKSDDDTSLMGALIECVARCLIKEREDDDAFRRSNRELEFER